MNENEKWAAFEKHSIEENQKYWRDRTPELTRERRRERKGVYYLGLSVISLLGGIAGLVYGLVGLDWVQKPYVVMGAVLILFGLSIVIGGFGKVKS